jgi:DNA-binding MarR family transcriptional regulator
MTAYPQLKLDNQLCFPLYAATRAVTRRYAELLEGTGLTYPQYLVVLVLMEREQPTSVGDLGAELRLDSGTLTPLLKRLEAAGLVRRERDPEDERRVLVDLTDAGWRLRPRLAEIPKQLMGSMKLTLGEAVGLRDQLNTLIANLDQP